MTLGVEVMAVGPWSQPAPWWGLMWVDGHSGMHCHLTDLRTSLFVVSSCGHPASTPCPPYPLPLAHSCPAGPPGPPAPSPNQMALPGFPGEREPVWGPPQRETLGEMKPEGGARGWMQEQAKQEGAHTHTHSHSTQMHTHARTRGDEETIAFDKLMQNFAIRRLIKRLFYFQR